MATLFKLKASLSVADVLSVMGDLHPVVEAHSGFLSARHAEGNAFVDGTLSAYDSLKRLQVEAVKERGEADRALSGRTALRAEIRAYVKAVKKRVQLAARFVGRKDARESRALLVDYGIRGNQKNINRISHLELALLTIVDAHQTHGDTLKAWGSDEAFIAKGLALAEQLPNVTKALTKERSEAEKAIDIRDDAYETALLLFNDALFIVEVFGEEDDAVLSDFESVVSKHRALLSSAADLGGLVFDEASDTDNSEGGVGPEVG